MREQLTLGELLRDLAIANAEAANTSWVDMAFAVIAALPPGTEFTTDDLWLHLDRPREPRAMGAAMVRASKRSLVEATGVYVKSKRAECHARPVAVWRRA